MFLVPSALLSRTLPLLAHRWSSRSGTWQRGWWVVTAEMAGWAGPILAVLASPNPSSTVLMFLVAMGMALWSLRACGGTTSALAHEVSSVVTVVHGSEQHPSHITYERIECLVYTALCIFCIDYPNFGERFMKSETYGVTLMDVGIGCSLYSSGLTFGLRSRAPGLGKRFLTNSLPLLIIGGIRTMFLQSIGYRVETSEYGLHWNAFITMATVPLLHGVLTSVVDVLRWIMNVARIVSRTPFHHDVTKQGGRGGVVVGRRDRLLQEAAVATAGFVLYQFLVLQPLAPFLLDDSSRTGLLSANKEGIASLYGFLMIYLMGTIRAQYAKDASSRTAGTTTSSSRRRNASTTSALFSSYFDVLALGVLSLGLSILLDTSLQPVSRRMANLPYVCYNLAINGLTLECTGWVVRWSGGDVAGAFTAAVNKHQLVFFIMSNLLTGLINVTMDTHAFTDLQSLGFQIVLATILFWALFIFDWLLKSRPSSSSKRKEQRTTTSTAAAK